jgi:serine/threonine-protein kinase
MPPPANIPELIDRVQRSGVVPQSKLDTFLADLPTRGREPATIAEMLERLIEAGLITRFHADKFAIGKYKGFQLGNYLILDQLSGDGFGQVYLAHHVNMNRLVALKALSPQAYENDPIARERFYREARAAGTLDHPNIVRVFDLCQDGKLLYLVMEYVEGATLQSVVSNYGPMDVPVACNYARQVAFGLQRAHELGFVHRDIRPANILVDRTGLVKILDFGLVRSESDEGELTRQAVEKSILGTADYIAPEQAVDSSVVDIRADIYSLGATLYFLLTGRTLFPEGRPGQKMIWQQTKDPVAVNQLRPEVSPQLAAVIHHMLKKRPNDRPQTPAEVFDALAPFSPNEITAPDPAWIPERSARVALTRGALPAPSSASIPMLSIPSSLTHTPAPGVPQIRPGSGSNIRRDSQTAPSVAEPSPPKPLPKGLVETTRISDTPLTRSRAEMDLNAEPPAEEYDEPTPAPPQRKPQSKRVPADVEATPSKGVSPRVVVLTLCGAVAVALLAVVAVKMFG